MNKITKYILFLPAVLLFTSCKKYLDVNENPNSPTKAPLNGLLGGVTEGTALNEYRVADIVSYYTQYLSSSNTASPSDTYEPIDASTTWTKLYDVMTDIYDMDKQAGELGSTRHQGVARILMAVNLKMVHDLWGDSPYSESFASQVLTPVYDGAQSNFERCLALLDEGISLLQQGSSTVDLDEALDFIHHGDTDAWIKTAFALKARFLNSVSKSSEYNADNVLTALNSAYTSNDDDAAVTVFDVRNPWAQAAVDNANLILDGWLSEHYINTMNGTIYGVFDPRIALITDTTKYGDYRGTRNGKGRVGSGVNYDECYLSLTGYYSSTNSPLFIINYAECKFIEAEAYFRKNDKPNAYAAYLDGITANMTKMGVATADRDTYINDPSVSVTEDNITLDLIMKEKYKALFLSPETWNDARRYDYQYQDFELPLNAVTSSFVRRLVYPSVETSRNGINTPDITDVTQKLWWDQ